MSVSEHGNHHGSGHAEHKPWFEEWFSHPLYLEVYSHRDASEAAGCIRTIIRQTGLDSRSPSSVNILDIACGAGRHALEFARIGYRVTGNDLSGFLLEKAREEALALGIQVRFTKNDMRALSEERQYDLVVQLFTSFGYFKTQHDDRLVLRNVHKALLPGGWYCLDLINPSWLKRNLVGSSRRGIKQATVAEKRRIADSRIVKEITITPEKGEPLHFTESVKLFSRREIETMLAETGFILDSIAGDYAGSPFDEESSARMMLFVRKP